MSSVPIREADVQISNNQRDFIVKALSEEVRIDGRRPLDYRKILLQYALDDKSCTVLLGQTRVLSVVTAELEAPYLDRPNEGSLRFNVEFSPMGSPNFEPSRPTEEAIELSRLVERGLRETKAVDLEALCVLAGRKVWSLRVDSHILDNNGNLADAVSLSALAALLAFRRPEVTLEPGAEGEGQRVVVHSVDVREPLPLSIHHTPLAITFASFQSGELLVVDPSLEEEAAAQGLMTVVMNAFGELCAVQKSSGIALPTSEIMRMIRLAEHKAKELSEVVKSSLKAHEVERVQARIRRHTQLPPASQTHGRAVTVLTSDAAAGFHKASILSQPLDSGSDDSDFVSTSQSEDEQMGSEGHADVQSQDGEVDMEHATTSGLADSTQLALNSPHTEEYPGHEQQPQPGKPNWRQARPPKALPTSQISELSLEQQAAMLAGGGETGNSGLQEAVKPPENWRKRGRHAA